MTDCNAPEALPFYAPAHKADTEHCLSEALVLDWAEVILHERFLRSNYLVSPDLARSYLRVAFGKEDREVFGMVLLDNRHGVLDITKLFYGTIDGASVHPREVVKTALSHNAAAVLLVHNHPSGNPEPSTADRRLTDRLKEALQLVGVRVIDHMVIGSDEVVSFAERGLI
ncbi:RadC family protein [Marinimicrobium agarilyticum]|uniref:RadC family protein n=1 Tax=Marinimicrobium agarilyticum TaxID=306546 RepID=UPI0004031143|nr:DNA repair protein RadC [Marinimicrobium agarilyticum]